MPRRLRVSRRVARDGRVLDPRDIKVTLSDDPEMDVLVFRARRSLAVVDAKLQEHRKGVRRDGQDVPGA